MRANWNPTLETWLRRADPKARLILEAATIAKDASNNPQADVKQRQTQWSAADSLVNLVAGNDGTVVLSGSPSVLVQSVTRNGFFTSLDLRSGNVIGAEVTFGGTTVPGAAVGNIQAYLDPAQGGPQQVVFWECQLYDVEDVPVSEGKTETGLGQFRVFPIGDPVRVTAPNTAGVVTFDYAARGGITPNGKGPVGTIDPTILFEIRGLKFDGSPAANIGWAHDTTVPSINAAGVLLREANYQAKPQNTWTRLYNNATPYVIVNLVSYVATATIAFTGANKFTLPAVPTSVVEFSCQGTTPSGSTLTFQARVAGGDPWVTIVDGSTIGAGLPTDVALALSATYQCQVILTSDAQHLVSPVLVLFGLREVAVTNFDGLLAAEPRVSWTLDPVTLKAEIAEAQFDVLRNGEQDYNSAIETLLAGNDLNAIDLRLWIGHPDLARNLWMLVDTFQLDDPQSSDGATLTLIAVSALQQLRQILPVYNVAAGTRTALIYANKTLAFVYDDLIAGQIGLPGRFYGPRLEDTSQTISKTIYDGDAKKEADAVAFLAGGSIIPSQGRLKFTRIIGNPADPTQGKEIRAIIPWNEVAFSLVTPGFRQRIPEYYVPYGWDVQNKRYVGEARGFHQAALNKLGAARIEAPQKPDDVVSQWIPAPPVISVTGLVRVGQTVTATCASSHNYTTGQMVTLAGAAPTAYNGTYPVTVIDATHFSYIVTGTPGAAGGTITATAGLANVIAQRQAQALGCGIIALSFALNYAHPEIELGDLIAVQTDWFAVNDPNTGRKITGRVWSVGVVMGQHDAYGRAFTIWVMSFGDLLAGNAAANRLGFALPEVYAADLQGEPDGTTRAVIRTRDCAAVRIATSTAADPSRATIQAAGLTAINADGNLPTGTLATLTPGQTLYVGILGYEKVDGSGSESTTICQVRITRLATRTKRLEWVAGDFKAVDSASQSALTETSVYSGVDSAGGISATVSAGIVIPIGVTITQVDCESDAVGTTPFGGPPSSVAYTLYRAIDGGTAVGIVSGSGAGSGSWAVDTNVASELVSSGRRYRLEAVMFTGASGGSYARFTRMGVTYTVPSEYETY